MEFTGLGGGLMLAAAAGLWLVYLLPTWFRRSEYLATERNAVRLQQTLRVMAATAEVPASVLAENSARGVAAQERALRQQQKQSDAVSRSRSALAARQERAAAAPTLPEAPPVFTRRAVPSARALANRRLRRTRALASLVLFGSLAAVVVQFSLMITTGVAEGAGAVLGFSSIVFLTAFAALRRLATIARRRRTAPAAARRRVPVSQSSVLDDQAVETGWTPVPLPRPLYLSRPAAQPWPMVIDPAEELRIAALESDRALRAAQDSPQVTPIGAPAATPVQPAAASRFASMGIVNTADAHGPDLDAVLRRRRAAG